MLTEEELIKMIDVRKKSNAFIPENSPDFCELKNKAESGDILSEFAYGEQLYFNDKYLESMYWISKAFFENKDSGRFFLNDLRLDCVRKLKEDFEIVKKDGYGFNPDTPINVFFVNGETDYLHSISLKNGYVLFYERVGSLSNKTKTIVDRYEVYTITKAPEMKLLKYCVYFNMYAMSNDKIAIEDFDFKVNLRDEKSKRVVDGLLLVGKDENISEKYEFNNDISKTSMGQLEKHLEKRIKDIKENNMIIHKTFGLDLGTTNSTASVFINGSSFCAEDAKQKTIPSIVGIKDGAFIVGAAAKNNVNLDRVRSIKRLMGKNEQVTLNNRQYKPDEISAEIVRYCADLLNKQIKKNSNVVYDRIVITVPAYFSAAQKDATRKAGELAGLDVLMLLEEPTAAAINYTVKNNISNGVFMVYDLGGGTFDVSIIEKIENIPVVLATAGNNFLGGDNFDNLLARYFIDVLNNDLGYDIDTELKTSDHHKFNALLLAAENVKKNLSQNEIFTINYYDVFKDNSGVDLIIEDFSRSKFEEIIKDKIIIDTFNECDKAIKIFEESGRNVSEIDGILMVGGSSHIPYVKQAIQEKYIDSGLIKQIIISDPDLAVGYGAGIIAATQSIVIDDKEKNISIEINAPYLFDNVTNISGKVINGNITKIGMVSKNNEWTANINDDKTFSIDIPDSIENLDYKFYSGDDEIVSVSEEVSSNNLIAPTPVQNETIRIEIIDLEKQEIDNFPLVNKGESLPCKASHNFKVNEYSREQIILPVKEGYREIYRIVADLPKNTAIGSRITINTEIDVLGKVTLSVLLNNKNIDSKIIYSDVKTVGSDFDNIDEQFHDKIINTKGKERDLFMERQENIVRELEEAKSNADNGHYTDVLDKYENLVNELPNQVSNLTEQDFDNIEKELKDLAKTNKNINLSKIEDDLYFGKRSLARKDYAQAQERYHNLCSTKELLSIPPKTIFIIMLKHITDIMQDAEKIRYSIDDDSLIKSIDNEIELLNQYLKTLNLPEFDSYSDEQIEDLTQKLIAKSQRLCALLEETGVKEINEKIKNFQGRISKD